MTSDPASTARKCASAASAWFSAPTKLVCAVTWFASPEPIADRPPEADPGVDHHPVESAEFLDGPRTRPDGDAVIDVEALDQDRRPG